MDFHCLWNPYSENQGKSEIQGLKEEDSSLSGGVTVLAQQTWKIL